MADVFSKAHRSWIMSRVRGRDTKPEKTLIRAVRRAGYKALCYVRSLPGTPDVVLPDEKIVLLCHGCFWHGHPKCKRAGLPGSNRAFWRKKIARNRCRDGKQVRELRGLGWSIGIFWSCRRIDAASVLLRIRRIMARR